MASGLPATLQALGAALSDKLFPKPLAGVDSTAAFVGQRAAHVAQTTLYGYLKARMGTRFPEFFEDPDFSATIRAAAVRLFATCAADLSIFVAARVAAAAGLDAPGAAALARRLYAGALRAGLADVGADDLPPDAEQAFAQRAARTVWAGAGEGLATFASSAEDLVRVAPVVDDFKELDQQIVRNSVRLRWIDVRDQLDTRLDVAAVAADWRGAGR